MMDCFYLLQLIDLIWIYIKLAKHSPGTCVSLTCKQHLCSNNVQHEYFLKRRLCEMIMRNLYNSIHVKLKRWNIQHDSPRATHTAYNHIQCCSMFTRQRSSSLYRRWKHSRSLGGKHRLQLLGSYVWRRTGGSTCLAWYLRVGSSSVCSDQFNTTSQRVCRPPVFPLDPRAQRMLLAAP